VKGIVAWFARNHVAANLLMLLLVVGGLVALPLIQQKTFPDINIEVIQISVPYLGAAPEEVEEGVCVRIEEEIQGINGIEKIHSTAAEGTCVVSAELISGSDIDRALSEIKNAVDAIDTLPVEAEKPIVSHYTVKRTAVQLALSGAIDERSLKVLGERVRDEIASLPGITQVELASARRYEISIEVPEESLRRHRLTFDQVVQAVRRSSLDLPGGSIKAEGGEILLRTKGQAKVGRDFEDIVVLTRPDGTRLLLSEVARVEDGFEEDDRSAAFDGEKALLIIVYRVGDQKVIEVVDQVKQYVEQVRPRLPEGVKLTIWRDGSQSLRDRLDILLRNGMSGFALVLVLLACFLRLRLALWVSLGIPVSFLGALALFPALDIPITVISLFAFILVLGLLVDDAIVVGENVHTHQEQAEDPLEAAIVGTQEVTVPVIFGVLTTVAAFLPIMMAPGPLGEIFAGIGLVVVLCLVFSLTESQLILPSHLGHVRTGKPMGPRGSLSARWKRFQDATSGSLVWIARDLYRPLLERVLEWRYAAVCGGIALLMCVIALAGAGHIRFSFFPPVGSDYVTANLSMPLGTPVEETARAVAELEAAAVRAKARLDAEYPQLETSIVQHVLSVVGEAPTSGGGGSRGDRPGGAGSHLGEVSLELMSADRRPLEAADVAKVWREEVPALAGVEDLHFSSSIFSAGDPINLQLRSADVEQLQHASERLKARLGEYPGVIDVADSHRAGKQEIKLAILPSAQALGLGLDDLARQVRQAFYGEEAQRIQRDREDVRVMVRYPRENRRSLGDLEQMRIRTPDGSEVPFASVARVERGRGYATIQRSDRQRVINVTADVDLSRANANEVMQDLRSHVLPGLLAEHPGLHYDVEGEQREQAKVMSAMISATSLALFVIYALLAVPLRSYSQPFVIMAVIPFGLVGALVGHLLMGKTLSMMSVFGVVALSGVVVNSSLVLVHYVNGRRALGDSLEEAVRTAGEARFRPIVLTSLTTFAGLTPLLLERSVSAQFLIPMAISLGFGVVFATGVTLFLVPCSVLILEDVGALLRRRRPARTPSPVAARVTEIPRTAPGRALNARRGDFG